MRTHGHLPDSHLADQLLNKSTAKPLVAWRHRMLWMLAAVAMIASQPSWALEVYKCREAGKISYTSDPSLSPACQPVDLKVIEPNPADVVRAIQEKQRKAAEEQAAEEKSREERLVRAREIEAQAALRHARAAEEEARLLSLRQQAAANQAGYPVWDYPIWPSHRHFHFNHRFHNRPGLSSISLGQPAPNAEFHFSVGHHHHHRRK